MKVVVVGAGFMGHGIGAVYALGGHNVTLVDQAEDVLDRARAGVARVFDSLSDAGILEEGEAIAARNRLSFTTTAEAACQDADLIQEAVPEVLVLKQELFALLERSAPATAILGTNTSSLRITEIADRMLEPDRLIGIHWISPPHIVPIVEIVRSDIVRDDVVARSTDAIEAMGRVPVVVKDVPGFLVNRLQSAYRNAALSLIEQDIASARDIDAAVKYAIAPRQYAFGMFKMFDLVVNLKTSLAVGNYLFDATGDERYRPSPIIRQMVDEGRLGLASGRGWYDYQSTPRELVENRRDAAFLEVYRQQRRLEPLFDVLRPVPEISNDTDT